MELLKDNLNQLWGLVRDKLLLIALIIGAAFFAWSFFHKGDGARTMPDYTRPPEEKKVQDIPRQAVAPPPRIIIIEKKEVSKKLDLPEEIKADPKKEITANAEIPPYEGKTSVLATIDTETGESRIYAKQKPLSFFGFPNKKEIGIGVGFSSMLGEYAQLYGEWRFARVWVLRAKARGEINQSVTRPEAEGRAVLNLYYEW